jgi:hypothetical protein
MFSRLKDFMEGNIVGTENSGIDQCIKDHLVNLQSRFSKYRPETIRDKYKWITDQFHVDSPQNYEFSLEEEEEEEEEENYIDVISGTSLEVQFPRKSYIKFWVGIIARLCDTGFSAMAALKTKHHSA